jgi:hypothetical protein
MQNVMAQLRNLLRAPGSVVFVRHLSGGVTQTCEQDGVIC